MDKKTITGITAAIVLFAGLYGLNRDSVKVGGAIIVDTPYSDTASLHSRIDLFTGRPIVAFITPSTHADNIQFLQEYPTVIKIVEVPDDFAESEIFKEISEDLPYMYARPEIKPGANRKIR